MTIEGSGATGLLCSDVLLVADPLGLRSVAMPSALGSTVHVDWLYTAAPAQAQALSQQGVDILLLPCGALGSITSINATLDLFQGEGAELFEANMDWLSSINVWPTAPASFNQTVTLRTSDVGPGDYLAIARLDGLDPMVMFGTGGVTGHSAVVLADEHGDLMVVESTAANPFGKVYWPPPYGIRLTPLEEWLQLGVAAEYHVGLLPLSAKYRAQFNSTNAWNFFKNVQGQPYGFHSFIFSVLDTRNSNLPQPFSDRLLNLVVSLWDEFVPSNSSNPSMAGMSAYGLFIESLNHRFTTGGPCKNFTCVMAALAAMDTTLAELAAQPEQDSWRYDGGNYSMVCSVFAAHVYKAGFGANAPVYQAEEQTPVDNYRMAIFEQPGDAHNRFSAATCPGGYTTTPHGSFCQLMGWWKLPLGETGYNTIPLYADMNSACPSQWPSYYRCPATNPTCC